MTAGTARCDLTELYVSDCAHCRGVELPAEQDVVGAFIANFAGVCPDCGDAVDPGDRIVRTAAGTYIHAECAP